MACMSVMQQQQAETHSPSVRLGLRQDVLPGASPTFAWHTQALEEIHAENNHMDAQQVTNPANKVASNKLANQQFCTHPASHLETWAHRQAISGPHSQPCNVTRNGRSNACSR